MPNNPLIKTSDTAELAFNKTSSPAVNSTGGQLDEFASSLQTPRQRTALARS